MDLTYRRTLVLITGSLELRSGKVLCNMLWKAIAYVGSGITLFAFVAAVAAWVYRTKLLEAERIIRLAPKNQRASLIEKKLQSFNVDTSRLTNQQKYSLLIHQNLEQARRYRTRAIVVVVIAILAASVSAFAIFHIPTASSSTGSGSPAPATIPSPGTTSSSPQTFEYRVRVYDEKMLPIQGAWVTVKDNDRFTNNYTDSHGVFFTKLGSTADVVNISVEANGYVPYHANGLSIPESRIQEVGLKSANGGNLEDQTNKTKLEEEVRTAFQDPFLHDENVQKIRLKLKNLNTDLRSTDPSKREGVRKEISDALHELGVGYNYEPTDQELFEMLIKRIKEVNQGQAGQYNVLNIRQALRI